MRNGRITVAGHLTGLQDRPDRSHADGAPLSLSEKRKCRSDQNKGTTSR